MLIPSRIHSHPKLPFSQDGRMRDVVAAFLGSPFRNPHTVKLRIRKLLTAKEMIFVLNFLNRFFICLKFFWGRECSDLSAENTKIYLASHNHELLELSQTCSTPLWDPQHHFTYRVNYVLSTSLPDYKIPSMRTEPIQHLYSNHQAECLTSIW